MVSGDSKFLKKRAGEFSELEARKFIDFAQKLLPDARVFLFGSAVKGKSGPGSDVDVLIITKRTFSDIFEKSKTKLALLKYFPENPFEIHIVTPKQCRNWYSKFIKKDYLEA